MRLKRLIDDLFWVLNNRGRYRSLLIFRLDTTNGLSSCPPSLRGSHVASSSGRGSTTERCCCQSALDGYVTAYSTARRRPYRPDDARREVQQMCDHAPAIPRLGVPKYDWWNEGLDGVAFSGHATNFPQVIGIAATWEASLVHRMGQTIRPRHAQSTTRLCAKTTTRCSSGLRSGRRKSISFAIRGGESTRGMKNRTYRYLTRQTAVSLWLRP
jgi:hypothetical protein